MTNLITSSYEWLSLWLHGTKFINKQAIMDDHYIGCSTKFIIKKTLPLDAHRFNIKFSKGFRDYQSALTQ